MPVWQGDVGRAVRSLCTFHCCCYRERRYVRCQESCCFGSLQANSSVVYSSPHIPRGLWDPAVRQPQQESTSVKGDMGLWWSWEGRTSTF